MRLLEFLTGKRFSFPFVYSDEYWMVDLGKSVVPVRKYRLIYERLLALGVRKENFLESPLIDDEDILRVHTAKYISKLKTGELTKAEIQALELPFSPELSRFAWLHVGGTALACERALACGLAFHLGGGFHHAFADHGEGFCALNDTAVALEKLKAEGLIRRAMIVDCDVHQGNGTAAFFTGREDIFTFSIHQMDIYPAEKPPSRLDVGLWSGDGDEAYLTAMQAHFPALYESFRPDLVVYLAGADPLTGDKLGGLTMTLEGMAERDRIVIEGARRLNIPLAVVLAGGYGRELEDTVQVHMNTIKVAQKAGVRRRLTGRAGSEPA
ncbi:MAG: histone deacetylase [Candidatus Aminicenantes bacterium]|nr:histone deacetylase [Candidatus Aminicenantes bacterium]